MWSGHRAISNAGTIIAILFSILLLIAAITSTTRSSALPDLEQIGLDDSTALTIQVHKKQMDNNTADILAIDNQALSVQASYRFFQDDSANVLKLPLLGYDNSSLTFENGTKALLVPNQAVSTIAYIANITCPTNPSRTNITYGQPVTILLTRNVSDATLYYNYSEQDLRPNKNDGLYHLSLWTFVPVSKIILPVQSQMHYYAEETCSIDTTNDRSSKAIFYDIIFDMNGRQETGQSSNNVSQHFMTGQEALSKASIDNYFLKDNAFEPEFGYLDYIGDHDKDGKELYNWYSADPANGKIGHLVHEKISVTYLHSLANATNSEREKDRFVWGIGFIVPTSIHFLFVDAETGEILGEWVQCPQCVCHHRISGISESPGSQT